MSTKNWKTDFLWAHFNVMKFVNIKCPPILINFKIYNPNRDIDESEMPIPFILINAIDNAELRGKMSRNWNLRRLEFRHATRGREDFTHECPTSAKFFEFLQSLDHIFMRGDYIVSKFIEIVEKNGAIIEGNLNHE